MTLFQQISALLSEGDLDAALDAAKSAVKTGPSDAQARNLYIDLLIVAGDYERADNQCGLAATFQPDAVMGFALLRNQLRGMAARDAWFNTGAVPDFPDGPTELDRLAMRLAVVDREGDAQTAGDLLRELDALRGEKPMLCNGKPVSDFRDLDDRIPHALEVIMSGGAYLWIDYARIAQLRIEPVRRPRDFAFRPAELTLMDGAVAPVLLPVIYHSSNSMDADARLGRVTDWKALPTGLTTGHGQRCFLVADQMMSLSEISELASPIGTTAQRIAHG
ncbi:type VI secretion system accessory protein TagJ [Rhizobium helianthi]|uniref:Type VI secretion system accessory protein TagJ n=1 Tax=Rhizobium helianthi TaxID=1132695 RepID=A0ABW4M174_9HYPH